MATKKVNLMKRFVCGWMADEHKNAGKVAEVLGMSERTFFRRLEDNKWTMSQLRVLFISAGATDDEIVRIMKGN